MVYFESGGGNTEYRRNNDNKERKKERTNEKKKNIAKAGRNIHKKQNQKQARTKDAQPVIDAIS